MHFLPRATFVENQSNWSSGVQMPWDIFTRFWRYLCSTVKSDNKVGYCLTPASSVRREINGWNIPAVPATFRQSIAALLIFSTGLVVGEGGGEVGGGGGGGGI